ncbi:murein tripeptide amidase MpaA [Pectobacteriaceae bacterium CE70]|nr:murein tripeptide amidase MpaA [Pectobacteriaceae bacterium CE70]WJY12714.1 murein tripeptide amidase MpaA [Pectobacteriaceae bacterium C80]
MTQHALPYRDRQSRGFFSTSSEPYGHSRLGAPLLYFPAEIQHSGSGLIIAGTHGDETASTIALSCAMRSLAPGHRHHHVILAVNPDGCQLGIRSNANGVDINRNFPASNWQPGETVYRWNDATKARDVTLSTGDAPGSEPETQALCQLIDRLSPPWVVSFHEPLACIDDPQCSVLGTWMAYHFSLPQVDNVGYGTPGSFGSWCADRALLCITAELPVIAADTANERYLDPMVNLLGHNFLYQN